MYSIDTKGLMSAQILVSNPTERDSMAGAASHVLKIGQASTKNKGHITYKVAAANGDVVVSGSVSANVASTVPYTAPGTDYDVTFTVSGTMPEGATCAVVGTAAGDIDGDGETDVQQISAARFTGNGHGEVVFGCAPAGGGGVFVG